MSNPYEVLGVSPDATDQQIKTAYRELAKKYHPDNYANTPLADLATEKMKEVNEAYDLIMNQRKNRGSNGYNAGYSSFQEVRNLFLSGNLNQAEQILDSTPLEARNAEWFFLKGSIQYRRGILEQAFFNIQTACNMDPQNMEYRSVLNRMNSERNGTFNNASYNVYNQYNDPRRSGDSSCNACDMCSCLICSDTCCECMGGDLISCC